MPPIEFVDPDPNPGEDEELVSGPRREWSTRTKRIVRLGAAAVLAAVAGSAAFGLVQHGSGSTPSAVPAPATGTAHPRLSRGTPSISSSSVEFACPDAHACELVLTLPSSVRQALTAHLPGVGGIVGGSVLVPDSRTALRSRQVTAHAGRLDVGVLVQPALAGERPGSRSASEGTGERLSATVLRRGLSVTVTVTGQRDRVPGLAAVRALAADQRLLRVE